MLYSKLYDEYTQGTHKHKQIIMMIIIIKEKKKEEKKNTGNCATNHTNH